jgi:hypothetical protein
MTQTLYAPRHKKDKYFFRWNELCDDGYGIYVPNGKELNVSECLLLDKPDLLWRKNSLYSEGSKRIHNTDIEFVEITISYTL